VNIAQQAIAEREAVRESRYSVIEGGHVIRDFGDIVDWHARLLVELE
jgi:hypothetical protein